MSRFGIRALVGVALMVIALAACGDDGECVDNDGDGFGDGCGKPDCDDGDALHHADCLSCNDPDKDGRGVACDLGGDCAPSDGKHWQDCGACTDGDLDGRGGACDLGDDCDDGDPDSWAACGGCTDGDGDAHFTGCDAYVTRPGPDCDDADADNWLRCGMCADVDADSYFANCDAYGSHQGPDCNDADNNNWSSCASCEDRDNDTYHAGCDAYASIVGPDCNDANALHWADCNTCVDTDLDGRGTGCDLGSDCGTTDRDNWMSCATCRDADSDLRFTGCDAYFVHLGPDCDDTNGNTWNSCGTCRDNDVDGYYSGCDSYADRPGPDCNDGDRNNWNACGTCRDFDNDGRFNNCDAYVTIEGPDCSDTDINNWTSCSTCRDADGDLRSANCDAYVTIGGPDCNDASNLHWSDCATCTDTDGDGRGTMCDLGSDCNDSSVQHWSDCGTCIDGDGDGRGAGCDLGVDCDDSNPNRYTGAPDPTVDGIDQDCNGIDGPGLFDNFDDGVLGPVWTATGDSGLQTTYAFSGLYSLNLGGGIGNVESTTIDTSVCTQVVWRYQGKRGPESPDSGEYLRLEYWNGTTWIGIDAWQGTTTVDTTFAPREGYISAADARSASFRVRFRSNGSGTGTDDYYIDDFTLGCANDTDSDGVADPLDCAPLDRDHWSDCGTCVDGDGDDYGASCNRGTDCNDANPAVNPAASDPTVDGTDQNCDGVDGPITTTTYASTVNPTVITDSGTSAFGCAATNSAVSVINVSDPGTIFDVNVTFNATHPRGNDLDVWMQFSNNGTPLCVQLSTDNGFAANFTNTVFDDEATTFIYNGASPFTGSFKPESVLSVLKNVSKVGTWTLYVNDDTFGSAGQIDSWSVTIRSF